jgi:hypothetical protein
MEKSNKEEFSNLSLASIHEAGHALIYHLLGNSIDFIEVSDSGSGFVSCVIKTPSIKSTNSLEKYGMVCLSGYLAEAKFTRRRITGNITVVGTNGTKPSEDNEINIFRQMIDKYYSNRNSKFINELYFNMVQQTTQRILSKPPNWSGILKLAAELEERYFIRGGEVHEILERFVRFASL